MPSKLTDVLDCHPLRVLRRLSVRGRLGPLCLPRPKTMASATRPPRSLSSPPSTSVPVITSRPSVGCCVQPSAATPHLSLRGERRIGVRRHCGSAYRRALHRPRRESSPPALGRRYPRSATGTPAG